MVPIVKRKLLYQRSTRKEIKAELIYRWKSNFMPFPKVLGIIHTISNDIFIPRFLVRNVKAWHFALLMDFLCELQGLIQDDKLPFLIFMQPTYS